MTNLVDLLAPTSVVISGLALVLNIVLCPIILFRSNQSIGQYKYLLLGFVILELLFSICELLLVPVIQETGNSFCVYARHIYSSFWISQFFLNLWHFVTPLIPVILAFCFLYRYGIICSPRVLDCFTNGKKRLIFTIIFAVTLLTCGGCVVFFMQPSEEKKPKLESTIQLQGLNLTERAYLSLTLYNKDRSMTIDGITSVLCYMPTYYWCFTVYGYTTIKIMRFFKSQKMVLSDHNLHGQKQLFQMLIYQTITPLFTLFIPISNGVLLAFMSKDVGEMNQYNSIQLPLAALIDPFIIFYFIVDYRKALTGCFSVKSTVIVSDATPSFLKSEIQN